MWAAAPHESAQIGKPFAFTWRVKASKEIEQFVGNWVLGWVWQVADSVSLRAVHHLAAWCWAWQHHRVLNAAQDVVGILSKGVLSRQRALYGYAALCPIGDDLL